MTIASKSETKLQLSLLDISTLLYHVHRGAQKETVGFEDCDRTLSELTDDLMKKRVFVTMSAVESALWSANLMDEIGEFWSPKQETFDQFIRRLLKHANTKESLEFDRIYNFIREHKGLQPTK